MYQIMEAVTLSLGNVQYQVTIAVILTTILLARWWRSRSDPMERFITPNRAKDTVILHQYGKGSTVPSISPFVMKLETYLRVTNIPYVNSYSRRPGPKGKLPWIQYKDMIVPDSQFCIQFLNAERTIDLNKHLTPTQIAIGHLLRKTVEDSLYWTIVMWRLIFEKTGIVYRKLGLPSALIWYIRRAARSGLWSHGIGRYSQEEVTQIMEADLAAVSQILGDNNFLFGNDLSDVSEFDCALFGQLCQLVWQMPGTSLGEDIAKNYPNLVNFCERMKTAFWPDWNDRIIHPSIKSEDKVMSNVEDKVMSNVEDKVMSNVEDKVMSNVEDKVMSNVEEDKVMSNAEEEQRSSTEIRIISNKVPEVRTRLGSVSSRRRSSFKTGTVGYGQDSLIQSLNGDLSKAVINSNQIMLCPHGSI